MITLSEYLVRVQLIRPNDQEIFNVLSGGPMSTPSEYLVSRPIEHPGNIEWSVRLTNAYTE